MLSEMTPKDILHEYNQKTSAAVSPRAVQIEQRKPFVIPKLYRCLFKKSNLLRAFYRKEHKIV